MPNFDNISEWLDVTADVKIGIEELNGLKAVTATARHTFTVWGVIGFTDDLIRAVADQLKSMGVTDIIDIEIHSIDWD